jgi:hypothetical protein
MKAARFEFNQWSNVESNPFIHALAEGEYLAGNPPCTFVVKYHVRECQAAL